MCNTDGMASAILRVYVDLPRYSDKYRPTAVARPSLKRQDLNAAFFPPEIFEGYFNPKKRKGGSIIMPLHHLPTLLAVEKKKSKQPKANFDDLEREEQEGDGDEVRSSYRYRVYPFNPRVLRQDGDEEKKEGEEEEPDYDQDEEEDDNDYVEEYFDNGEGDDEDYLGGPRGDDGGGAGTH